MLKSLPDISDLRQFGPKILQI